MIRWQSERSFEQQNLVSRTNVLLPDSQYVSHVKFDFLLEVEQVIVEGYGVVLVNTDEAGTLIVTNFCLIFLREGTRNIIALGTIPLTTIEKFSKMLHLLPLAIFMDHLANKSRVLIGNHGRTFELAFISYNLKGTCVVDRRVEEGITRSLG
nr:isoform 2 of phosphatidylinositol-3-phosphatase myotubularin-1 [Quercus suber]